MTTNTNDTLTATSAKNLGRPDYAKLTPGEYLTLYGYLLDTAREMTPEQLERAWNEDECTWTLFHTAIGRAIGNEPGKTIKDGQCYHWFAMLDEEYGADDIADCLVPIGQFLHWFMALPVKEPEPEPEPLDLTNADLYVHIEWVNQFECGATYEDFAQAFGADMGTHLWGKFVQYDNSIIELWSRLDIPYRLELTKAIREWNRPDQVQPGK